MSTKSFDKQLNEFSKLSDFEIITRLKHDDLLPFSELLSRYYPLIRNIEKRYYIAGMEWDDWVQESSCLLWKVVGKYDVDRNISFGAYFKQILINQRVDLLRESLACKRQINRIAVSLDVNPEFFQDNLQDYGTVLPETKTLFNEAVQGYLTNQLSPLERDVLIRVLKHLTFAEIADDLQISFRKVRSAYERAHKKAKILARG